MKNGELTPVDTLLFITHQLPKGLQVDEVFRFGQQGQQPQMMGVVKQEEDNG